jgi:isopenicillin-N N-acyltransferase like protein
MKFLIIVLLAALLRSASAAFCSGAPDPGEFTNDFPVLDGDMTLKKQVKNGALYETGPSNARFDVVHVWGSAYEMGQAQGQLVGEKITKFVHGLFAYIKDSAIDPTKYPHVPEAMKKMILQKGIDRALDWTAKVTADYTPKSFYDELHGIADAVEGVDYDILLRLQMFPEVTKASCSFFGAWKGASKDDVTYHMRSLDYDTDGPFSNFPQVTVYHPEGPSDSKAGNSQNAFASVGWPATVGTLTGMSDKQMSINEIGVSCADDSFGQGTPDTPPEKVHGKPWMFVVRDILQHTDSLDAGVQSVQDADRTCNLIIGVGDGKPGAEMVKGIEYSGVVANPYWDVNQLPVNETWHPKLDSVVYNGMDWDCPTYTEKLGDQLNKYHGDIQASNVIGNILPSVQTGNLHIALYDLTNQYMFLSFSRSESADQSEPVYAYQRQFTKLDMQSVFGVPKPTVE